MASDWGTIESSPDVFSTLLWELGVQGLQVEDLWSLDLDLLDEVGPIYAFIFLFKYPTDSSPAANAGSAETGDFKTPEGKYFFANQTIQNACATLALLNATLNISQSSTSSSFSLGEELTNIKSFTEDLDPETRGWTIASSDKLRTVHNSFARNDPFVLEGTSRPQSDDVYHFITYLPINGDVYELDGLQHAPLSHGAFSLKKEKQKTFPFPRSPAGVPELEIGWTEKAREVVERRMAGQGGVGFNLMAIVEDKLTKYNDRLNIIREKLESGISDEEIESLMAEMNYWEERIKDEEAKREKWKFDNSLRRHNFIGFVQQLLSGLASEGHLASRIESAKETMKERVEKMKASGKSPDDDVDMM